MRVCEFEAKALLKDHGLTIPRSILVDEEGRFDAEAWTEGGVAKAQLLTGGRGKAGLVRITHGADALASEVRALRARLHGEGRPAAILAEEKLDIAAEYYLSCVIDDVAQCTRLLFSLQGGMDIEEAQHAVHAFAVDPLVELRPHHLLRFFQEAGVPGEILGPLTRLAVSAHRAFVAEDAEMLEINPLAVLRSGRLLPLDAKLVLDDSAAWRHRGRCLPLSTRLEDAERTLLEREADRIGFTFVEMPGEVAIMSSGAGLGMMLVDLIGQAGLRPACFVDGAVGSHSDQTAERLCMVLKRAQSDDVKAIFFYQNLGTRDLKPRVEALLSILKETPPPKPFYFGLAATYLAERSMSAKQACELMRSHGYISSDEPAELVAQIRRDLGR